MGAGNLESDAPVISTKAVLRQDANTITLEDFTYDGSVEGKRVISAMLWTQLPILITDSDYVHNT